MKEWLRRVCDFKSFLQAALTGCRGYLLPTEQWVPTQCQTIVMDLGNIIWRWEFGDAAKALQSQQLKAGLSATLPICLQGYKSGRILLQHGDLQVPWEEVALLSAVVGNLLLDPDGRLKSAEGTLHSHSLLMGDPVFRAQSLYSFGITGAVIPLALCGTAWEEWWNSWHPRHAFWYPFSTWYWLGLRRGSESWFLALWQYWALNLGLHTCWTSILPLSYTTSCLPPF